MRGLPGGLSRLEHSRSIFGPAIIFGFDFIFWSDFIFYRAKSIFWPVLLSTLFFVFSPDFISGSLPGLNSDLFPVGVKNSEAQMSALSDKDLENITGAGFSNFSIVNNVVRAEFDIMAWTYTEIDSMKTGYYDDGVTTGWDNDWTNVDIGSPAQDMVAHSVYFEAVFENIDNPATRQLKSVKLGFMDVSGTIAANFNSFSGDITAGSPISGHRITPVFTSITMDHTGASISLDVDGAQKGFWVHFDNASTN